MIGAASVAAAPRRVPEAVEHELAMLEAQRRRASWVGDAERAARLASARHQLLSRYGLPSDPEAPVVVENEPLPAEASDEPLPAAAREQLAKLERRRQAAEEAGQAVWAEQLAQRMEQIRSDYGLAPPWPEVSGDEAPQRTAEAQARDKPEPRDIRGVRYDVRGDLQWFGDIRDDVREQRAKDLRSIPGENIRELKPSAPPE